MFLASITVVLNDTTQQVVKAIGDTEDEAVSHLSDAAIGINVAGIVHSTLRVDEVFNHDIEQSLRFGYDPEQE